MQPFVRPGYRALANSEKQMTFPWTLLNEKILYICHGAIHKKHKLQLERVFSNQNFHFRPM